MKLCHYYSQNCDFIKENGIQPCCVSHLLEMFKKLSQILIDNNIFFFITYGTLLGYERHNGIIPWDDDLDIMCVGSDKLKILYLCKLLLPDYDVQRHIGGSVNEKYPQYDYIAIYYSKINRNHVDIGFLEKINDNYMIDSTVEQAIQIEKNGLINKYKKHLFPVKYLLPLKETTFYNIKCYVPNKSLELLKHSYGEDVMIQTYIKDKHIAGNIQDLTKSDKNIFLPAKTLEFNKIENPTSNNIHKILIINIEKRKDRLYNTIQECNKINVMCKEQKAVEGNILKKEELINSGIIKNKELQMNEYGCYLSHVNCLIEIAKDNDEDHLYIIVEDDIKFIDSFNTIIDDNIEYIRKNKGIYLLGGILYNTLQYDNIYKNIYDTGLTTGTWAYLLDTTIAKKILDKILPIIIQYDLVVTAPNIKKYPTNIKYSNVLSETIKKYSIFDNNQKFEIVNNFSRFGIVKEYSTFNNDSTSAKDYIKNYEKVNTKYYAKVNTKDYAKVNKKINKKLYTIFKWYLCIIIMIIIMMIIYKVYKRK